MTWSRQAVGLLPERTDGEFRTSERCFMTELLNDPLIEDVSVARCRVEPGVTTELHRLNVDEWYLVETGDGLMRLGAGPSFSVTSGDRIQIPKGTAQQIQNQSDSDLIFLCVCRPRFTPDGYTSLEGDGNYQASRSNEGG